MKFESAVRPPATPATTIDKRLDTLMNGIEMLTTHLGNTQRVVSAMSADLANVKTRLDNHSDMIMNRIYITVSKCNILSKAVKTKVSELCKKYGLDYRTQARYVFAALYGSLKDQYTVASYREIPDHQFDNALEIVRSWDNLNKIKERLTA